MLPATLSVNIPILPPTLRQADNFIEAKVRKKDHSNVL